MPSWAQFHSNGESRAGLKWRELGAGGHTIVVPDYGEEMARKVLFMLDTLKGTIGYGLLPEGGVEPLSMPVVMHTENGASNGITIMAPERIEMCAVPAVESYATPWLRQLSVHEYRHAAQYAALFGGSARWFYYLLGEQALLATTGVMPFWWLEGDAVDAETQASLFGRALQPSFTMHYRAVGRRILEGENPDKWFSGSYNEYIPSHYNLGYQMVTAANRLAGEYVWDDVMAYARRHPYTIMPYEWAMRKRLGYSTEELFRTTFERLNDLWESLPSREDSAQRVAIEGDNRRYEDSFVSVRYPLWLSENKVVVVESSFDEPTALVEVDVESGKRRVLCHTGNLHTRPAKIGDYIYWTELQQLSSFAQQMGSVLCRTRVDGKGGAQRALDRDVYALYPTDFLGEVAYVRYDFEGTYTVVCPRWEMTLPAGVECHGMATVGDELFLLTTGDGGMAVEAVRPGEEGRRVVREASRVTLSHLTASQDGRLYFGSVASGYDEVHSLDPRTGEEHRLTTSRYGSFYGAPSPSGGRLALTVYDADGYHLALTPADVSQERVEWSLLPQSVVNPEVYRWAEVVCVDTLRYGAREAAAMQRRVSSKPFRRGADVLNIHSWAPAYYRPEQLMSGNLTGVRFGATVTTQSLLSDAVGSAGIYWMPGGSVGANLNLKYTGWLPKLELNLYGDSSAAGVAKPQGVVMQNGDYYANYDHSEKVEMPTAKGGYIALYGRVYMPLVLSHSYLTSVVTPSVELSTNNNLLYDPYTGSYHRGQSAVAATLQWNSYTRSAYRNLQPRWGVALIGGVGSLLSSLETPLTWGAYARIYTPGFGRNDGFTLRGSYQDIAGTGPLSYALDFGWLSPRGARTAVYPDDMVAGSLQYDAPLCYPDWGLKGVVMLKRVRASLFVDTLWGRLATAEGEPRKWSDATTLGADLWLDTSWLRLPEQGDLTIRVGCYFDTRAWLKPTITGGVNLNF